MKIYWTDKARRDLLTIGRYIAEDNPRAARVWVDRLRSRARDAAKMPFAGRLVPERFEEELREVFFRNYRIVYRIHENAVQVLTVFEGHRLFPSDAATNQDDLDSRD